MERERDGVANELALLAKRLNHSVEQTIAYDCNTFLIN